MKRTAVVSDVHSNIEALTAVLADADALGCEDVVCLGDLIGYGPNPRQVLRIALQRFRFTLLGNHEEAVMTSPDGFNWKAEASAYWTRRQLRSPRFSASENRRFWEYLTTLPQYKREDDVLWVHASPMDAQREYILPESCYNRTLMRALFARLRRVGFGGHTHMPGIFFPDREFVPQDRIDGAVDVTRGKYFVNVGSVGQPRDGDVRACYGVFDGRAVLFRRVEYNYRITARKIKRIRRLPTALGARLQYGL